MVVGSGYKLKVLTWIILFLSYQFILADPSRKSNESEPLEAVESNHGQKIFIKKINKHNHDGTYTVGYEANDGTFKYESKDVLGNVKGTIGYVNDGGMIVRKVTYTTSNKTALDDVTTDGDDEIKPKLQRNVTSFYDQAITTRRSPVSLVYPHGATSSTRSPAIQAIPRKKIVLGSSTTTSTTTSVPTTSKPYAYYTRQGTGDVLSSTSLSTLSATTSTTTPIPTKVIFTTSAPSSSSSTVRLMQLYEHLNKPSTTQAPGRQDKDENEGIAQLSRPRAHIMDESTSTHPQSDEYYRKVLGARQSSSSVGDSETVKPNLTNLSKISLEDVNVKELQTRPPKSNTIRRQLNNDKENIYDNVMSRPEDDSHDIYGNSMGTQTQRPLFTTTQDASKQIVTPRQFYRNSHFPYHQVRSQKGAHDKTETLSEAPTTQSSINPDEEPYVSHQNPIPVNIDPKFRRVLRLRQRAPYNVENHEEQAPNGYYYEQTQPNRQAAYGPQRFPDPDAVSRLRNPVPAPVTAPISHYNPSYSENNYPIPPPPPGYAYAPVNYAHAPNANSYLSPAVYNRQPIPYQPNYVQNIPNIPNIPNNYGINESPPLTIRDFQQLLQQLIYVQRKLQQLTQTFQQYQINTGYQPSGSYPGPVEPQIHPQSNYIEPNQYESQYIQHVPPKNRYPPDYLPGDVREMLLLRMLQLAINSEVAATDQMEAVATTPSKLAPTPRPTRKYASGNRNVKILGVESDQVTLGQRNKRDDLDEEEMDMNE